MSIRQHISAAAVVVALALNLNLTGCAQAPAGAPASMSALPPRPLLPADTSAPIEGIRLPRASVQGVVGYEVHGSGETIQPPVGNAVTSEPGGGISFNFVNASVTAVAQTIFGQLLKENYTIDGGVQGNITLATTRPISRDEVIPALETSLQMANLALTREADGYHIVPIANATEAGAGNLSIAGGPQTVGYGYEIIPLKYASAASIQKLVQPLAQSNVQIQADTTHNLLIVAGTSQDRAAIAANVAVFDVNWLAGMSYALVPLQNASASAVVKEIDEVIGGSDNPMNGVVRLVVIGQLNAILVVTPQDQYLSQIKSWIERLDQQQQSVKRQVFVYHVQNGRASDIAKTLNELLGQGGSDSGNGTGNGQPAADNNPGTNDSSFSGQDVSQSQSNGVSSGMALIGGSGSANGPGASAASQGDSYQNSLEGPLNNNSQDQSTGSDQNTSDAMRITADDSDNALLIYATADQYRSLQNSLAELDVAPMQVMLEAVVAEVTLTDELRYGVQYFFQSGRVESVNTLGKVNAVSQALPGFSAILNPGANIQILLDALESITHVNVISAPRLLVLNNQPAELQVGDEVPITTQTAQGTVTGNAPLVSTVQYQPTGVILHVTPRINSGGLVTLDISQEVSQVSATTTSTLNSPTISERKISTIVAVPNGQTVALGGLIQTNDTATNGGIPLLDRIPGFGVLFSNRDTSGTRTELLVLITPHVVQSASSLEAVTDALRNELSDVPY